MKDMEMSCDEKVMKEAGGDLRKNYARTLLVLASKQSGLLAPLSFSESHVKSRVRNILHYRRTKRLPAKAGRFTNWRLKVAFPG